jgi:hypothetical protein
MGKSPALVRGYFSCPTARPAEETGSSSRRIVSLEPSAACRASLLSTPASHRQPRRQERQPVSIAKIDPPRSWPDPLKARFRSLPYDLQVYVEKHERDREKTVRRAQNEAAQARQALKVPGSGYPRSFSPLRFDHPELSWRYSAPSPARYRRRTITEIRADSYEVTRANARALKNGRLPGGTGLSASLKPRLAPGFSPFGLHP